jgi:Tfp pilus assembly protein PilO
MSKSKQFFICLGVGLLFLILGYATDINFLQSKLRYEKEQKIKLKQLLQNKTQEIKKLPKQDVAPSQKSGNDFSVINILNSLEKAAADSQTELQLLEPQSIKEEESLVVYPVRLEVYGQYKKLMEFLNNVLKQPYFTLFEELILQKKSTDDRNNDLNLQVLLVVYKNKKSTEGAIKNGIISLVERDVFVKAASKANLFLWSERELHFLGVVKQKQNIYGFVSDPLGMIYRVAVGDKIGLKQNKIIAIDESGVKTITTTAYTPFKDVI